MSKAIRTKKLNTSFDFRKNRNKFVFIVTDTLDATLLNVPDTYIKNKDYVAIIKSIQKNIIETQVYPILIIPYNTSGTTQENIISTYKDFIEKNLSGLCGVIGLTEDGNLDYDVLIETINTAILSGKSGRRTLKEINRSITILEQRLELPEVTNNPSELMREIGRAHV